MTSAISLPDVRRAQAARFDTRIDCHLARARVDHALGRASNSGE